MLVIFWQIFGCTVFQPNECFCFVVPRAIRPQGLVKNLTVCGCFVLGYQKGRFSVIYVSNNIILEYFV
jgi:hypothetical protein